tara:strand:- start:612 stop:2015 length:1404 start_codon:yes stop_codon:yes gene_type:complete
MRTLSIIILFFSSSFLFSQQLVNSDLFGLTTETTFIFTNVRDSNFISKVKKISPKILRFPGSNFYHFGGVGYGLDIDEIDEWHRAGFPKRARGLLRNSKQRGHKHDYIEDFIVLAKKINARVIITANIITAKDDETVNILKKLKSNGIEVIGVEMGAELSNQSYNHKVNKDNYIVWSKKCAKKIKEFYPDMKITVVAAPLMNNPLNRHSLWNRALAKETFYDGIIVHNYVKVTTGEDRYGKMITESKEADSKKIAFDIYKKRVLKFFSTGFIEKIQQYNLVFDNKPIWITEWNLQYSKITGNTLFQGLFSVHYFLDLASEPELRKVELTTFHNLAGRDYGGSIFRSFQGVLEEQVTYYPMQMLSNVFEDNSLIITKKVISNECFQYDIMDDNSILKYSFIINWSGNDRKIKFDKTLLNSEIDQFCGDDLYSLADNEEDLIHFSSELKYNVNELLLKPYSLTLIKVKH